MVWKLLRHNINLWQIAAWAAASVVGLCVIGLALQFYRDISPANSLGAEDPLEHTRYLTLSRPATPAMLTGSPGGISEKEIKELAGQPWAESAAPFTPAGFDVTVSLASGAHCFSTAIFLEGVPEEYLDLVPSDWDFDPLSPRVAIILPRDYLALYNFGFAPARGLPVIDERTARLAPLNVTLSGNGVSQTIPGEIVGFSSRLNTIAVPDSFVTWANSRFAANPDQRPSRLVVKLADPGDPAINNYLAAHDLEKSAGGESSSRMFHFLRLVSGAVMGVGLLICLLSLGLMTLSLFLLLQKNRPAITSLLNLGYTPGAIAMRYVCLTCVVNICVLILAGGATALVAALWQDSLRQVGMRPCPVWPTLAAMAATVALLTLSNAGAIHQAIRKAWRG